MTILPIKVFAQQDYGCGTYGSGNYSEGDCVTPTNTPTPTPTPTNTPTPPPGSTSTPTPVPGSSSSGSASTPVSCDAPKPVDPAPTIFGGIPKSADQIEILFTKASEPFDRFSLEYGTSSGYYTFGVADIQPKTLQSYTVNFLLPGATYFFRIRGVNVCSAGSWSNEFSAKTRGLIVFNALDITSTEVVPEKETTQIEEEVEEETAKKTFDINVKVLDENGKPIEGASVTLYSTPKTAKTNKNGIAEFKDVEPGQHEVDIAYDGYQGRESLFLDEKVEAKVISVSVTVKPQLIYFSPLSLIIITSLSFLVLVLLILLKRKRKYI